MVTDPPPRGKARTGMAFIRIAGSPSYGSWSARQPEHHEERPIELFGYFLIDLADHAPNPIAAKRDHLVQPGAPQLSTFSAAINASCGMSTLPNCRIFFLPSSCFSRSLRLRVKLDCRRLRRGLARVPQITR